MKSNAIYEQLSNDDYSFFLWSQEELFPELSIWAIRPNLPISLVEHHFLRWGLDWFVGLVCFAFFIILFSPLVKELGE